MKNLQYILLSIIFGLLSFYSNAQTIYTVTKTTDPDPFVYEYNFDDNLCDPEMYGTLQWAVRKTNDTEELCKIEFNIPGQGIHNINSIHYFPQITNNVIIDASTQPGYIYGFPVITLNGQGQINHCFSIYNASNIEITGFNITGFKGACINLINCSNGHISNNTIELSNSTYGQTKFGFSRINMYNCENINIFGNILKTIDDGIQTPGPYNYGVDVYNCRNCTIGSTEINKSNEIFDCYVGVFIDSSQNIKVSGNTIFNNTKGVQLERGSNNSKKAPIILSYESGIVSGIGEIGDEIEVFGSTGNENSNEYLGTITADENGYWTLAVTPSYDYLIATAKGQSYNTSEFSDAILVSPTCTKPTNLSSTEGISTSHTLTWDGPTGVTYNVAVGLKDLNPLDDNWMISYSQVTGNSTTITGLDENTEYEFYMNANCGTELSYWAGPFAFNFPNVIIPETTRLTDEFCGATVFSNGTLCAIALENVNAYTFWIMNVNDGDIIEITNNCSTLAIENIYENIYEETVLKVRVKGVNGQILFAYGDTCEVIVRPSIIKPEIVENNDNYAMCGYTPEWAIYYNSQHVRDSMAMFVENAKLGTMQCGNHFAITFLDSNGIGFDDSSVGEQRRNCACEVLTYLESVIQIPDGVVINIRFDDSGPINGNPDALAAGGPFWNDDFNSGVPGLYGGNIYDFITTGIDPDPDFDFDGHVQVNFPNFSFSTCESNITSCSYDLYTVLLHEFLHAFGLLSLIREDSQTLLPTTVTSLNQFTIYDNTFLFHGDITDPSSFEPLILPPINNPTINPSITAGELRDNMWWISNAGQYQNNQPIYSGGDYQGGGGDSFGNVFPGSFLSHMDAVRHTFTYRGWLSPGYLPRYIMNPTLCEGEVKREISLPEIRMLEDLGYVLTAEYSAIVGNNPPYTTKQTTNPHTGVLSYLDVNPNFDFPETIDFDYQIINNGNPLVININSDPEIIDTDGNIVKVEDGSLFNIRGCGTGNNHSQIALGANGTEIIFTPRQDFIGRAQFGFYLHDGIERGSFMVYTIDVLAGSNFSNSSNSNTPNSLSEIVINGNFENGSEIRTLYDEFKPYIGIDNGKGRIEGEFYSGAVFCDAHPYSQISWNWTTSPGATIIDGAYKPCNFGVRPFEFGHRALAYNNPSSISWNHPVSNNGDGDRYLILKSQLNFLRLSESLQSCNQYTLTFDCYNKNLNDFSLMIGFLDNAVSDMLDADFTYQFENEVESFAPNTWTTVSIPFTYCSDMECQFLNFYITEILEEDIYFDNISITQNTEQLPPISIIVSEDQTICEGGNAILSVEAENEKCELLYNWQPIEGLSDPNISNPIASPEHTTTYTVIVSDINGCESVSDEITINVIPDETLEVIMGEYDNICLNSGPVTLNASPSGGIWSGNSVIGHVFTPTVENLGSNIISYTVDNGICTNTELLDLTVVDVPNVSIVTEADVVCPNTFVQLTCMNTSSSFVTSYNWSNLDINSSTTAFILDQSLISVTVSDVNGCIDEATISIDVFDIVASAGEDQTICDEEQVILTATGGIDYVWSNGISQGMPFFPNITSNYVVTVTDENGCTATDDINVIVNEKPIIDMPTEESICLGESVAIGGVSIVTGGIPNYSYHWNNGSMLNQYNISSPVATPISTTPFTVVVTDSYGCTATETVTVTVNPNPDVNTTISSFPNCPGQSTYISAEGINGTPTYNYTWDGLGTEQTYEVFPTEETDYFVTVNDANGCSGTGSVTAEMAYSISNNVVNSCFGVDNGQIILTLELHPLNSLSNLNVTWSNSSTTVLNNVGGNIYETTLSGLSPGSYSYAINDNLGCVITDIVEVFQTPVPLIVTNPEPSCPNEATGGIEINITGGYGPFIFEWSNSTYNQNLTNVYSGTYALTTTDANSCTYSVTDFVDALPDVDIDVVSTTASYDGESGDATLSFVTTDTDLYSVQIASTDYYNFHTDVSLTTDYFIPHIPPGLYQATIQSEYSCTYRTLFSIANIITEVKPSCILGNNNGEIVLNLIVYGAGNSLPPTMSWLDNETNTYVSNCNVINAQPEMIKYQTILTGLAPGIYTYSIVDAWGNTITNEVIVESYVEPFITSDIGSSCLFPENGSIEIEVTEAQDPYLFNWSNGDYTQNIYDIATGHYDLTVTYADNCEYYTGFDVGSLIQPELDFINIVNSCYDDPSGIAEVDVINNPPLPYIYDWSNGNYTPMAMHLAAGTHTVTVTVGNGCVSSASVEIGEFPEITVSMSHDDLLCADNCDATATVNASGGGGGFSYYWSDPSHQTTATAIDLCVGDYSVIVTDANSCTVNASVTINSPTPLVLEVNTLDITCYGYNDGIASIYAHGGVPGYQYDIGNGLQSANSFTDLEVGDYTVTVYDSNNCSEEVSFSISEPLMWHANVYSYENISCFGYDDGEAIISVGGGQYPYQYNIGNGWQTSNEFENLMADHTYTVTVQDANGCTVSTPSFSLTEPSAITATYNINNPSYCSNDCDWDITAVGIGGTGDLQYTWFNGETTMYGANISDICDGDYYLTITDENECLFEDAYTLSSEYSSPEVPELEIPSCLFINSVLSFTDIANSDPSLVWYWSIGGETITDDNQLDYTFSDYGYYCLSVNVGNDECGYESYAAEQLFVNPGFCSCDVSEFGGGYYSYDYTDGYTIESGENEVWESPITNVEEIFYAEGDIIIEPDASLTIGEFARIEFAPNGRIIVMAGARLIIENNVTLTSIYYPPWAQTIDPSLTIPVCENNMWQGIEVWGDLEHPSNMGTVEIIDRKSVLIENAHIAILSGARSMDYLCDNIANPNPFDESKGCGLVIIAESDIELLNNGVGIKFLPRPNYTIGALWSGNVVNDCIFKTTIDLYDPHYSSDFTNSYPNVFNPWAGNANPYQRTDAGIEIDGVLGLGINGCTFDDMQYGITSVDSKYDVFDSYFTDMIWGINIKNMNPDIDNHHEIHECYFNLIPNEQTIAPSKQGPPPPPVSSNQPPTGACIYIDGGSFDYIHDNTFGNSGTIQSLNGNGVQLINTTGFRVIENNFSRIQFAVNISESGNSQSEGGYVGAGLSTTGDDWEGNLYNDCKINIYTTGTNDKLQLKCNMCSNLLESNYEINLKSSGSLANQGSMPIGLLQSTINNSRYAAGNEFDGGQSNDPYFRRISSSVPYDYFSHTEPVTTIPVPTTSSISLISTGIPKSSNEVSCKKPTIYHHPYPDIILELPSNFYPGFDYMSPIDLIDDELNELEFEYNNKLLSLDNGNTEQLLNDIYSRAPQGKLKNDLIQSSPLSDTVIIALTVEYPLSHGNFKNVMELNLPAATNVNPYLNERLKTIPVGIANQLIPLMANNPDVITPTSLKREIDFYELERQLFVNEVIYNLLDTSINEKTAAINLVENYNTESSKQILYSDLLDQNNYVDALILLQAMDQTTSEIEDWVELNEILLYLYENGKTIYDMDSVQIDFIRELAYKCPANRGSSGAKAILYNLYGEEVPTCVESQTRSSKIMLINIDFVMPDSDAYMEDNFPDPFTSRTLINYYLPEEKIGKIVVSDMFGRIISEYELSEGEHTLEIINKDWAPGVYNYGMFVNGKAVEFKKMVITQ